MLLEIIIVIAVIAFAANGFRAGAVETLGRLIGALVGFWAAKLFAVVPVTIVGLILPIGWAYVVSFLTIFLIANHLVGFLFSAADRVFGVLTKLPLIKQASELIGLILGILEAIVVIGGAAFLLRSAALNTGGIVETLLSLRTMQFIENAFTILLGFLL